MVEERETVGKGVLAEVEGSADSGEGRLEFGEGEGKDWRDLRMGFGSFMEAIF